MSFGSFAVQVLIIGLLLIFVVPKIGFVIAGIGLVLFALDILGSVLS